MDNLINIEDVATRTGLSVGRIRNLRTNAEIAKNGHHPLFSLGFKVGFGVNSRLLWRESDVDDFLEARRGAAASSR
ncbi:AlpA family transcriptional regulator [Rhodococcus sp. SORGH_AS_0303]|uniref:helix-turn-helix transcriptional regulator n=1 Tax=Rhodococcus sp. SORGH_AS_0303 TaxID=3041753 RepID=UPI00277E7194|nr:hypothetical protein [Rhodococcus sp. SORGH_AS_0303]MDQ1201096.1 putative DNA-binding transcriptional regulator AlpA [Rhodococcus sp. SORGH_AS_0303]